MTAAGPRRLVNQIDGELRDGDRKLARSLAADARATIEHLATRAPEPALRQTFLAWVRGQATLEEAERLRSG